MDGLFAVSTLRLYVQRMMWAVWAYVCFGVYVLLCVLCVNVCAFVCAAGRGGVGVGSARSGRCLGATSGETTLLHYTIG